MARAAFSDIDRRDRGWIKQATFASFVAGGLSFAMTHIFTLRSTSSLITLAFGAILLDAGTTANLVLVQRVIFSLGSKFRSRLNALYIVTIFVGGGTGSAIGAWAYAHGGWNFSSWVGLGLPLTGFLYFLSE